jgi:hypothetical protein
MPVKVVFEDCSGLDLLPLQAFRKKLQVLSCENNVESGFSQRILQELEFWVAYTEGGGHLTRLDTVS